MSKSNVEEGRSLLKQVDQKLIEVSELNQQEKPRVGRSTLPPPTIPSTSAFYTPEWLAKDMISLANIREGQTLLEPSSGHGALAVPARNAGAVVFCIELNETSCIMLRGLGFNPIHQNFLNLNDGFESFDRVLMNPPFTQDRYLDHVIHAIKFVRKGGRLVALVDPLYMYGRNVLELQLRNLTIRNGKLYKIESPHFDIDGEKVNTAILVLDL